jgi:hypothetical protein
MGTALSGNRLPNTVSLSLKPLALRAARAQWCNIYSTTPQIETNEVLFSSAGQRS